LQKTLKVQLYMRQLKGWLSKNDLKITAGALESYLGGKSD